MRATACARPNIALVKYWGKRDTRRNLPATGSISVTLDALHTTMSVDFAAGIERDRLRVNAAENPRLLPRLSRCLDAVLGAARPPARIESTCNFPIAAGLASSAAAFAALVVAVNAAMRQRRSELQLAQLAGQASGSAARSLFGGFVELRNDARGDAIDVQTILAADAWPLNIVAAVTASEPKATGSGSAMEISRRTSPFYSRWIDEQDADLALARDAIAARDFARLAAVAEHNCLKMHALTWTSRPAVMYWNAATVACMHTVRDLQRQGVAVFFTMDAGPQLKAVCLPDDARQVGDALAAVAGVEAVLVSGIGAGANVLSGAAADAAPQAVAPA